MEFLLKNPIPGALQMAQKCSSAVHECSRAAAFAGEPLTKSERCDACDAIRVVCIAAYIVARPLRSLPSSERQLKMKVVEIRSVKVQRIACSSGV